MDTSQEIKRAKTAMLLFDNKTALAILKAVIKAEPKNVDAWLTLADVVGDPEKSKHCLERVLQIDPGNSDAVAKLEGLTDKSSVVALPEQPEVQSLPPEASETPSPPTPVTTIPQPGPYETIQSAPAIKKETYKTAAVKPGPPEPIKSQPATVKKKAAASSNIRVKKEQQKEESSGRTLEFILIGVVVLILSCICVFVIVPFDEILSGAASLSDPETAIDSPIEVVYANIRASNAENKAAYLATIHPDSPGYSTTEELIDDLFPILDLKYQLSDVSLVSESSSRAVVQFTLTTTLVRGDAPFRDNRATGQMILRKHEGVWKIYNQEVDNVEYLE